MKSIHSQPPLLQMWTFFCQKFGNCCYPALNGLSHSSSLCWSSGVTCHNSHYLEPGSLGNSARAEGWTRCLLVPLPLLCFYDLCKRSVGGYLLLPAPDGISLLLLLQNVTCMLLNYRKYYFRTITQSTFPSQSSSKPSNFK